MKLLSCIALMFCVNSLALATPKIGDYAQYQLNVQNGSNSVDLSLIREILNQDSSGNFLVRQILQLPDGNQQVSETTEGADQFLTDATIDGLLANCAGAGGALQTVTVPAGSFETCAVPYTNESETGTAWIGKVSFGLVLIQSTSKEDGTMTTGQLVSFR